MDRYELAKEIERIFNDAKHEALGFIYANLPAEDITAELLPKAVETEKTPERWNNIGKTCYVEGCDRDATTKGKCFRCYQRLKWREKNGYKAMNDGKENIFLPIVNIPYAVMIPTTIVFHSAWRTFYDKYAHRLSAIELKAYMLDHAEGIWPPVDESPAEALV